LQIVKAQKDADVKHKTTEAETFELRTNHGPILPTRDVFDLRIQQKTMQQKEQWEYIKIPSEIPMQS